MKSKRFYRQLIKGTAALHIRTNMVASVGNIENALGQYYKLVEAIAPILLMVGCRAETDSMQGLMDELTENVGEERGSRTKGIPHKTLLQNALRNELRIDISGIKTNNATKNFLNSLMKSAMFETLSKALGRIYALEATAVPELIMVRELIKKFARREGIEIPAASELLEFIKIHVLDFEVGHESGLRNTLKPCNLNWEEFDKGFLETLRDMQTWWDKLALGE
ncbi:MAG TPA: DUF3865 domain-containing protein [Patescibacteria group bacterium]|nr:DUF3865 domain-containing protein [Patescibacteria group bacterium]